MNVLAILNSPFMQVALPIIVTFSVATWYQSKRIDDLRSDINTRFKDLSQDMNRQFGEVTRRLDRIEALL